jgi:hypothetical protein
MRYPGRRKRRFVLAALVAGIVSSSAYAFTASNAVVASNAGSGSQSISGYTATNVSYTLDTFVLAPQSARMPASTRRGAPAASAARLGTIVKEAPTGASFIRGSR